MFFICSTIHPPSCASSLSFGIRAGLSDLIPTNLERKDPVMDADQIQNTLPDVSMPPNKPPGFDGYNYPFWKFRMENYIKANGRHRTW